MAQILPPFVNMKPKAKLTKQLEIDVRELCQPCGRRVGTKGHKLAERWVEQRLQEIGCIPYHENSFSLPYEVDEVEFKNIGGNYPSNSQGLEALAKRPRSSPRPRDWVQAMDGEEFLFDPWDTKYKYEYSGSYDSSRPEIISAGPDKQFGSEDDMSSQKDSQN
tara:strand:+ start:730 stop:1218 length:489 start_codon:yes stop_codon:yes gene_type:complete